MQQKYEFLFISILECTKLTNALNYGHIKLPIYRVELIIIVQYLVIHKIEYLKIMIHKCKFLSILIASKAVGYICLWCSLVHVYACDWNVGYIYIFLHSRIAKSIYAVHCWSASFRFSSRKMQVARCVS